ncbi:MAG: tetratricopeptide repeat protein [Chloroflexi bacterium]|nr:tetratricopeptide repeat protein [Chloroflexota bacterium]
MTRIASILGVETANGTDESTLDALCLALRGKKLLVLDNCEHLIEEIEPVSRELLARSADLKILATSRQPLGVPGEFIFSVNPFYVPEGGDTFERLSKSDAVELFVVRSLAADPSFSLSHENIGQVAQICKHLDGLPLAIELVAAQTRITPIEGILERLEEREKLVVEEGILGGPKAGALENSIRSSYELLNNDEKELFTRLAVFRGGFTLNHAQQILPQDRVTKTRTHNHLSRLVDKSMVYFQRADETPQYSLLESLRLFGLKELEETSELEDAQIRHADVFCALAETLSEQLRGERTFAVMQALDEVVDNILAGMENSLRLDRTYIALRIACALRTYWIARPQLWRTILDLMDEIIKSSQDHSSPADLARAHEIAGALAIRMGDRSKANQHFFDGMEYARESEDTEILAYYAESQGWIFLRDGDKDTALEWFERSEELAQTVKSTQIESWANHGMAYAVWEDTKRALGYSIRAYELAQEAGSQLDIAAGFGKLLHLYARAGEYKKSEEAGIHVSSISSMINNKGDQSLGLINLGVLMQIQGSYEQAKEYYMKSLSIAQEIGYREGLLWACVSLGGILRIRGKHSGAEDYLKQCELLWNRLYWEGGKTAALVEYSLLMRDIDDLSQAKVLIDDALTTAQAHHFTADLSRCMWAAGTIYHRMSHPNSALRFYFDSIKEMDTLSYSSSLSSLEGIAIVLSESEKGELAVNIFSAVSALRNKSEAVAEPIEREQVGETVENLRRTMDGQEFAGAWEQGESMDLEETKRLATKAVAELLD